MSDVDTKTVATPGPDMARVRDTLVRPNGKPRTHDIGGKLYTFGYDEYVEMPLDRARTVAHIPEFEVLHPNGARIVTDGTQPVASGSNTVVLRSDQTIATFDELSEDAVRRRAKALGYGGSTRDLPQIVAFLMKRAAADAEKAASRQGRKRKLLVNGVVTEVDLDNPGRVGHDGLDPDIGYVVDAVDTAALLAQQQNRGMEARPRA